MITTITEKNIHLTFKVSITLKAMQAALEIISGFVLLSASQLSILNFITNITTKELIEDPGDFVVQFLLSQAGNLSISSKYFVAFYLLSHGILKLFLVIGLLKKKYWAYPSSIVIFSLFIVYQLYRFTITHSWWLILFTILDIGVIILTLYEYKILLTKKKNTYSTREP